VSPAEVARRLERMREAGERLRARPAGEVVDALARVVDGWRDAEGPWRSALARAHPEASGFSPRGVARGLELGFGALRGDTLWRVVERELGGVAALDGNADTIAGGFPTTAVVLAGSIPMPTLLAMVAPLALRSPVLVKPSSHDGVTAEAVARSVADVDEELGRCVELAHFAGDSDAHTRALLEADCVVAFGSDETTAGIAARLPRGRRFVAYGHRLSIAVLGDAATAGVALEDAARGLALDVALWDQQGCLSPVAVYVVSERAGAADAVAESLAAALAQTSRALPRGRVGAADAAAIAHERAAAEMRIAAAARVRLHAGADFTVVREADTVTRPSPLFRFVRVHPVADGSELERSLAPLARHLAGVAIAGFGDEDRAMARRLAALGASRICAPGMLQAPPLDWHHDGAGLLAPLARFTDDERRLGP
jgi:hypothetical protein